VKDTRFISLENQRTADGAVEVRVLAIANDPGGLDGGASMMSQSFRYDCARGRIFDGKQGYFDADGKPVGATVVYAGRHGRVLDPAEAESVVACSGRADPKAPVFADFRAAQRDMQMPPADYAKTAEARPDDASGFAWLCAAAARGRWRPEALSDCDRAVKLDPAAHDVGVDRAYLYFKVGKNAQARAGFDDVLSRDPQNAAALFGRGLMRAMAGDNAGSRVDRNKALDQSPRIFERIERRYGLYLSPEFRKKS
jgi:hypothetical protein